MPDHQALTARLTCACYLGALPRGSIMSILTGTEGRPLRLCYAMLGALETVENIHVHSIETSRTGWREKVEPWFLLLFYMRNKLFNPLPYPPLLELEHPHRHPTRVKKPWKPCLGTWKTHPGGPWGFPLPHFLPVHPTLPLLSS